MSQKVKSIILRDDKDYELIIDWESIQDKPLDLITKTELTAQDYQTAEQVQQIINEAIDSIPDYNGEIEETKEIFTIKTVATEAELTSLMASPPEEIAKGGQMIVQYTGETGKYTKNAYYIIEVSAQ